MQFKNEITDYLAREKEIFQKLNLDEIEKAMNAIYDAWMRGARIYTMGNGGSAATASHMVCDFNKGVSMATGKQFKLTCLNDNTPIMMAIANDIAYDQVFKFQLQNIVKPDDLLIAFSGSGNSKNVINAVEYAKEQGAQVIGATGYSGGKLAQLADYKLHVPCDDMQITEDVHMIFVHMIMQIFSTK